MSRGNIIQGQASGKLGDTVLMVRNGKQLARVYTTSGARSGESASESARIQRVKFGSASNQWALYRFVSTRMYRKGRKTSQSDYNYFVKRNNTLFPYLTKEENSDGVHCLQPGQFSEGNLGRIDLLHQIVTATGENPSFVVVSDTNSPNSLQLNWTAEVGSLKRELKVKYPAARKVTYLISVPKSIQIEEGIESFESQQVAHNAVVLDLYTEVTAGEDSQTIAAYFAARIQDTRLSTLIGSQEGVMSYDTRIMRISTTVDADRDYVTSLSVLLFATDDLASDCYTTILGENSVNILSGAYAVWAGYRTAEALRIASDSYGYQSGVMRDKIASYGDDLNQQVTAYAARLRTVDAAAADELMRKVAEAGTIRARQVRKITEPKDE